LAASFSAAYGGAKGVFLRAKDSSGLETGWVQVGTWTVPVPNQKPVVIVPAPLIQAAFQSHADHHSELQP
jgi:hypothetical protein